MSTLRAQLAYAPRGVGLAYAVVYLEKDPDICGWWIGAIGADKFDPVASRRRDCSRARKFNLSRSRQTERILKAMENPIVSVLAHPTGRLIDEREPYDADMPRIIRKARATGGHLELNAHPERLDLLDSHCRMAKEEGVMVSVNSDAHSVHEFDNLRFGVGQARRGWLEKKDVLNTRMLGEVRRLLRRPS